MHRLTRPAILLAWAAVLALPAVVKAQFILSTNNGQIAIVRYTGSNGAVTIPSTTNGLPVTNIGKGAFSSCTHLTSVTIPSSVTNIGRIAFCGCTSLTGIYFKGNAPRLGDDNVFYDAAKTTIYYLPNTTGWSNTFGGRPTAIWKQQTNNAATAESE